MIFSDFSGSLNAPRTVSHADTEEKKHSVSALEKTAENRRLDLKDLLPEGAVTDGILLLNQGQ